MALDQDQIRRYGDELYSALCERTTVAPLTERSPDISIEDAYHISTRMLERRVESGERVIGKKIGVTSAAVMNMLNVHQPDFGYLTDRMVYADGDEIPASRALIAPRAEGEIAFILKRDLIGPGITNAQVLAATECVMPCFEIVDSRIRDWRIKIQDTVADNASCGVFVLGDTARSPRELDLVACGMVMEKNGVIVATGAGAAALGSPVNCVAWLANKLGEHGKTLKKGMIVSTGSMVACQFVPPGSTAVGKIEGLGEVTLKYELPR